MCSAAVIVGFLWTSLGAGESPTEVVAAYGKFLDNLATCEFTLHSQGFYRGPASAIEISSGSEEWLVRRDQDRWNLVFHGTGIKFSDGKRSDWQAAKEYLLRPDGSVYVQHFQHTDMTVSVNLDASQARNPRNYLSYGAILLGYVAGDGEVRLDAVLGGTQVKAMAGEIVDGHTTLLLEAISNLGTHRAWLDPVAGSVPRRIEVRKRVGDLMRGQVIAKENLFPAGSMWPTTPIEEYSVVVENVKLDPKTKAWATFDQTVKFAHEGSQEAVFRTEHKVSGFNLTPKFSARAFEIELPVPEGTPVSVAGEQQIEYRWQNGWPHKYVDRGSLASAPTDDFKTDGKGSRHGWWVFVTSLVVVALAALFAFRRLTAQRG